MVYEFEKTFVGLYFKDKKVQPTSWESRMDWMTMAIHLNYETKDGKYSEDIELTSALDLLAKRILKAEESIMIE